MSGGKRMARVVSLVLLFGLLWLLGGMFFQVLAPFLLPLFLAWVAAMLCRPVYEWCLRRIGPRPRLAAALTTAGVLAAGLVPVLVVILGATAQLYSATRHTMQSRQWVDFMTKVEGAVDLELWAKRLEAMTGEPTTGEQLRTQIEQKVRLWGMSVANKTVGAAGATLAHIGDLAGLAVSVLTFVMGFYYFLVDGPKLIAAAETLIPVDRAYQQQLLLQFDQAVRGVVLATFAAAIGQGVATGIGLAVLGFPQILLLTMLATFSALVPLLGTWLVWGPCAVYLAVTGHYVSAALLAVYGMVFVGFLDNVIRAYVLNSSVELHPLLAFVSVLGGLQALGLWGVFLGPIIASCATALVRIVSGEVSHFTSNVSLGPGADSRARGSGDAPVDLRAVTDMAATEQGAGGVAPGGEAVAKSPEAVTGAVGAEAGKRLRTGPAVGTGAKRKRSRYKR